MSDVLPFTRILKVFWEEPAALGRRTGFPADTDDAAALLDALARAPSDSRLYLSATHADAGGTAASALSALDHGDWIDALSRTLVDAVDARPTPTGAARRRWMVAHDGLAPDLCATPLPRWPRALARIAPDDAAARDALDALVGDGPETGSAALSREALHALLDAGAAVLVPEPVADGLDLSVYAPVPLRDRLRAALAAAPVRGLRRFLAPYRTTRSEARFHFDRWEAGMPLPAGIEAV